MVTDWRTSIIHSDLADWTTVAAYLLAALLSAQATRRASRRFQARDTLFWKIAAIVMVLMASNELFDLQTILTSVGRAHAKANGWYGERRRIQFVFIMALGLVTVLFGIASVWLTRRERFSVRLALIGLQLLGAFFLVRAASFHHLDNALGLPAALFNLHRTLEMAGITTFAIAAVLYARSPGKGG